MREGLVLRILGDHGTCGTLGSLGGPGMRTPGSQAASWIEGSRDRSVLRSPYGSRNHYSHYSSII